MKINLEKHDRISFFGDSITAHGMWIREVAEYFSKNYPELEIGIYNSGIAGSRASGANLKDRMFCDCLQMFPKYVVVMFGMNDVEYGLHGSQDPDEIARMKASIAKYPDSLKNIINICKSAGATPIICSPTPYDEYNDGPNPTKPGIDEDLQGFAVVAKSIAEENGLLFVDMRDAIFGHIDEKPVREDRVHPNEYGHHLMAERFLTAIGAKETEEPEKVVEISEKNQKRFETEQILRKLMFVERDGMLWQFENYNRPLEERKELLAKTTAELDNEFWHLMNDNYKANADFKDELRGELVKLTLDMYKQV